MVHGECSRAVSVPPMGSARVGCHAAGEEGCTNVEDIGLEGVSTVFNQGGINDQGREERGIGEVTFPGGLQRVIYLKPRKGLGGKGWDSSKGHPEDGEGGMVGAKGVVKGGQGGGELVRHHCRGIKQDDINDRKVGRVRVRLPCRVVSLRDWLEVIINKPVVNRLRPGGDSRGGQGPGP